MILSGYNFRIIVVVMKAGVKVSLVGIGSRFGVKNTGKCFEIARRLIT